MSIQCKFCKDPLNQGLKYRVELVCTRCDENFGNSYCRECLPYYYIPKLKLCIKCERGIQG